MNHFQKFKIQNKLIAIAIFFDLSRILITITVCFCLDLLAPTNVTAIVSTPRSVEVTWDQSLLSDVTGYLISYNTTASYASGGSVMVDGIGNTSYTLAGLEENTVYAITVQATTNDNEISPYSIVVTVTTNTDGK